MANQVITEANKVEIAKAIISNLGAPIIEGMIGYIKETFDFSKCYYCSITQKYTLARIDGEYLENYEDQVDEKFFGE